MLCFLAAKNPCRFVSVSVLLSASVERYGVSCMRDFLRLIFEWVILDESLLDGSPLAGSGCARIEWQTEEDLKISRKAWNY